MILGWLDISWGCTKTCGCEKFFNIIHPLHNSLVFLPIKILTNQSGIFTIISREKGDMYFSRFFFLARGLFLWQIVIMQVWTKYTTALCDNFSGFSCWGDLILSKFQNQFCAYSSQPGQKCKSGLLLNTKMTAPLRIRDCVLVIGTDKGCI